MKDTVGLAHAAAGRVLCEEVCVKVESAGLPDLFKV
jgi:hypothetical protein